MPYRYAEMSPAELEARIAAKPLAIVPIGALEWHGPHLPLGLDGIVAEAFCERLAERTEGVLLPASWLPITTLPHPYSLDFRPQAISQIWLMLFLRLGEMGFKGICCVTGHYAQGHMMCLYQTALAAHVTSPDLNVMAASPLELLNDDSLLDHAARWETAQLLALRPELVRTSGLPEELSPKATAVLGGDPREATAEEGAALLDRALDAWAAWADRLLTDDADEDLRKALRERMDSYRGYVERYYKGSWDDAIRAWWDER